MKLSITILIAFFISIISIKSNAQSISEQSKNTKIKNNYLASETDKAIEYNKSHKKRNAKSIEKKRLKDQKELNELNHQKHAPAPKKKEEDKGQFKMF